MNPIGVTPVAVGTMTSATMTAVRAAGSVTPKVMRKRRDVAGNVLTTAKADGLATAKVIPKPHVAAGSVPTTATAAGTATPKAIRKRLAAVGTRDTARNVAMMTMSDRAVQAGERTNIEAVRGMMRIVATKAGVVPMTTTTVAPLWAAADMAAGLATPKAIPKRRVAVGKTVGNRRALQQIRPWLRPGAPMENCHVDNKSKGSRRAVLRHPQGHLLCRETNPSRLPKMAKSACSGELSEAFEKHRQETEGHVQRLEQIFEAMGKPARGKTCDAIVGILEEGKEIMEDYAGDAALDAGLAASAQAVEHYEIARYGTLRTWADELGMKDALKLLDQTLQEEIKTDQLLTKLATSAVNRKKPPKQRTLAGKRNQRARLRCPHESDPRDIAA